MTRRSYALWDVETGNMVGAYETQQEALFDVLESARRNGPEDVDLLGLVYNDEENQLHTIAEGPALLRLAEETLGQHTRA